MHVLHVIGYMRPDKGGAQEIIRLITGRQNASARSEHTHSVFAAFHVGEASQGVTSFGLNKWLSPMTVPSALRKFAIDKKADVLHIHSPLLGYAARSVGNKLGLPCITTVHNYPERYRGGVATIERRTILNDACIVCVSGGVRQSLLKCMNVSDTPVRVIHNGIGLSKWQSVRVSRQSSGAEESAVDKGSIKISAVGSLHRKKGWDVLIEAVCLLKKNGCMVDVDIIGDGAEKRSLEELAHSRGVSDCVRLNGASMDIARYLESCDIAVYPSRWEGFGLAFLEAVVSGVPVVASRLAPFQEIFPECPHFVEVEDAAQLANEIQQLIADLPAQKMAAIASAQLVEKRFDAAQMVRSYDELYTEFGQ